jgi:hypothetical protein
MRLAYLRFPLRWVSITDHLEMYFPFFLHIGGGRKSVWIVTPYLYPLSGILSEGRFISAHHNQQ